MLQSIEAYYKDGKIELKELPDKIKEGKVIVTFLDSTDNKTDDALGSKLDKYIGTLSWNGDPLEYQKKLREEWDD